MTFAYPSHSHIPKYMEDVLKSMDRRCAIQSNDIPAPWILTFHNTFSFDWFMHTFSEMESLLMRYGFDAVVMCIVVHKIVLDAIRQRTSRTTDVFKFIGNILVCDIVGFHETYQGKRYHDVLGLVTMKGFHAYVMLYGSTNTEHWIATKNDRTRTRVFLNDDSLLFCFPDDAWEKSEVDETSWFTRQS